MGDLEALVTPLLEAGVPLPEQHPLTASEGLAEGVRAAVDEYNSRVVSWLADHPVQREVEALPVQPLVTVQRIDEYVADGEARTSWEVVDRRLPKAGRIVRAFASEEEARRFVFLVSTGSGGAYQLDAVDTDEYFHDTDYELLGNGQFYGVIGGCDVTFDTTDLTLDIAAGCILHNGTYTSVAAQLNALTLVADASNKRWSYVTLGSAGTAVLVSGDPAASSAVEPTKPELGDRVLLRMVKLQAAQTIANNAEYKLDKRVRIGFPVRVRKVTDESVQSNTLQDDDELKFNVTAGEVWHVTFKLQGTSANNASQGFKLALTFPAASTALAGLYGFDAAGATWFSTPAAAVTTGVAFRDTAGNNASAVYEVTAYFVFTASGTVVLQWAQSTTNATNTTVEAGSFMEIQRAA